MARRRFGFGYAERSVSQEGDAIAALRLYGRRLRTEMLVHERVLTLSVMDGRLKKRVATSFADGVRFGNRQVENRQKSG